jgi:hypothetical protein
MTFLAAWLAFAVAGNGGAPDTTTANLIGTWVYVTEEDRHIDGTQAHLVPSAGYDGFLVYTENGYVTAQIYPRGRKWASDSATHEELQSTFDLSASYFGTYKVNASTGQITHHVLAALDPSAVNWDDQKSFTLSGDQLVLRGTWDVRGETILYAVTWRRVR